MARYDKSLLCFEWLDSTKIPKALRAAERSRQKKKTDVAFSINLRSFFFLASHYYWPLAAAVRLCLLLVFLPSFTTRMISVFVVPQVRYNVTGRDHPLTNLFSDRITVSPSLY